ncbi:MAG TPA: glycosyltransferase family 2 protein [Hydrogenophaga sp.]|uniref:glycosyltransferase family 2 protein n=1 Tax=Hydrogenophaga sp. TaxID=1904254 RepID=UPI002CF70E9F|nr:glycosyltransferase family 2 protein [Hydrogenophaga sp.]HMN91988.1 glycosyltransferase family 2 protein [Hydrogenophaga sp.]HMP08790.1 glycosyltransferase family 2 protein [Hydrogenophaga sp.]
MSVASLPTVLTVVLNYRTPDLAIRAVEAALVAMEGLSGAITVVDNDSQDGSFERLSEAVRARGWDRVRVLPSGRNGGYGAGNNFGIRQGLPDGSKPDFVYILNSDAFPEPDAIRRLLDPLQAHPDAGFAGSRLHGEDGVYHQTAFRFPGIFSEFESGAGTGPISRLLRRYVVALPEPKEAQWVDWMAGASLLVRQRMLDEVGLFDETFFLYFEETDLSLRARRAGWKSVYVPESRVMHIGSVSTGMKTWKRMPSFWFDSRLHYFVKNHGVAYATAATLAYTAGAMIFKLRSVLGKRRSGPAERFLSDLLQHALRSAWQRRIGAGSGASPS